MKKSLKILIPIVIILALIIVLFYLVDKNRANNNKSPIFCIKTQVANDGGSTIYMGIGYKVIKYKNLRDDNEVYSIGSWKLEFNNPYINAEKMEAPLPTVYSYFSNPNEGVALCVGDQAMGTYALQTYSTIDGGKDWTLETEGYDKFISVNIKANYLFISNKIGFIFNPSRSESEAMLLMTRDGGKTFNSVVLVDDVTLEIFDNVNQLKKTAVYDYYELPSYKDGILTVIVSQGIDGDYKGGKTALEYQSKDMGMTWDFAREFIK